jgi:hypothetical protein
VLLAQGRHELVAEEAFVPDLYAAAQRASFGAQSSEALRFSGVLISGGTSKRGSSAGSSSASSARSSNSGAAAPGATVAPEDVLLDATDAEDEAGDADAEVLVYVPTHSLSFKHSHDRQGADAAHDGQHHHAHNAHEQPQGSRRGSMQGWRPLEGVLNVLLPGRRRSSSAVRGGQQGQRPGGKAAGGGADLLGEQQHGRDGSSSSDEASSDSGGRDSGSMLESGQLVFWD